MSRELEALEEIQNHKIKLDANIKYDNGDETQYRFETIKDMFPKQFAIIETALKRISELERENFELSEQVGMYATYKCEDEKKLKAFELPEDYKFVYQIKGCENKFDFDTNTIVEKILSTRTKQVDEEIIKQLKNIGEEKCINELILIDESKVLKMIKSVKALEIIKEKGLDILKFRHAFSLYEYNACKSVGCKELTQEEYDLLKKVLK